MKSPGVLKKRFLRPEIMDDPDMDVRRHEQALKGLQRINFFSCVADRMFAALASWNRGKKTPLKILDIASGGGDVTLAIAHKARQRDLPLEIHGCDKSQTAVRYAQASAREKQLPVHFFQVDISRVSIPSHYDVIMSSLFLHHLPVLETLRFLKKIAAVSKQGIILNDLRRCWPGYLLATTIPQLLTSCKVVHEDGVQSVRAAYSLKEIIRISERAGLRGASIQPVWPFRYQMVWRKP